MAVTGCSPSAVMGSFHCSISMSGERKTGHQLKAALPRASCAALFCILAPGRLSVGEITFGFAAPGYSITENECGFAATYLAGVWPFAANAGVKKIGGDWSNGGHTDKLQARSK